jgi:hypothetical protein
MVKTFEQFVNENINEGRERYVWDTYLAIPVKLTKQIGMTSKWEGVWPDGHQVTIDTFDNNYKKISVNVYPELSKKFLYQEDFKKQVYKDAKAQDRDK